jgi:teichuronic acid biosynthesis glycosyltransferase TuaH
MVSRQLQHATRRLGGEVRGVLSVKSRPPFGSVRARRNVYWVRDDFAAGAALMNLPEGRVRRDMMRMAAEADAVVAVSPVLARMWSDLGFPTTFVPNGCDAAGLAAVDDAEPADDVDLPSPIAGVIGTIGDRIDFGLLRAVADSGVSVLLVGARQKRFALDRIRDLLDRPNVVWTGPRPYSQLPSYLRLVDVGLVPYRDIAFNRASFPLKTLEYLAAGRPVVSTDLAATRWLGTPLIRVASGPAETVAAVHVAAADSGVAAVAARRTFAAGHDWSQRAAELLEVLS